jgi:hypothetical protein
MIATPSSSEGRGQPPLLGFWPRSAAASGCRDCGRRRDPDSAHGHSRVRATKSGAPHLLFAHPRSTQIAL